MPTGEQGLDIAAAAVWTRSALHLHENSSPRSIPHHQSARRHRQNVANTREDAGTPTTFLSENAGFLRLCDYCLSVPHAWIATVISTVVASLFTALPAQAAAVTGAPAPDTTLSTPMAKEKFVLHGRFPAQAVARKIYLQRYDTKAKKWSNVSSQDSANGFYSFRGQIGVSTQFRVVTPGTSDGGAYIQSSVRPITVVGQAVGAWIRRSCNNTCSGPAVAYGFIRPVRNKRSVTLYIQGRSSWQAVAKSTTDSAGNFKIPFGVSKLSKWTTRNFRVVAGSYNYSVQASSSNIAFMPGPSQLGRNALYIDVDRGILPKKKGADYSGYATLVRDGNVQINRARLDRFGVRGSTTSEFTKKPYNMRFDKNPGVPVFGMKADTSWTLLAMFVDQSFVRDKTAMDLGRKLSGMTWNPDSEYVELFVNSEYRGAYLLVEKPRIDGDRVDLGKDSGIIMETDGIEKSSSRYGFTTSHGLNFAAKDPDKYDYRSNGSLDPDGLTTTKLGNVRKQVSRLESALYGGGDYNKYMHRASAIDYYLVKEFFKDIDGHFWRSDYITYDSEGGCGNLCDGRIHFGPVWDFDRSAGNLDATTPVDSYIRSPRGWYMNGTGISYAVTRRPTYKTQWFAQLWKSPSFQRAVKSRWDDVQSTFVATYSSEVSRNKALIGVGASNDRARWKSEPKRYRAKGSGYSGEVQYVASWLKTRYGWMNDRLE